MSTGIAFMDDRLRVFANVVATSNACGVGTDVDGALRLDAPAGGSVRACVGNLPVFTADADTTQLFSSLYLDQKVVMITPAMHMPNKLALGGGSNPVGNYYDPYETRIYGLGTETNGLSIRTANDTSHSQFYSNSSKTAAISCGTVTGAGGTLTDLGGRLAVGGQTFGKPTWQLAIEYDSARKPATNTWTVSSDERVKTDIELANTHLCCDLVKALPLKRFRWLEPVASKTGDQRVLGFLAQDVRALFPKSVSVAPEYGFDDFHSLNDDQIIKAMFGALQRALVQLDASRERITLLEKQVTEHHVRLTALEGGL